MKNKKKLLITGSSGHLGKALIKYLKKKKISYFVLKTQEIQKQNILKYKNITHVIHLGFRMNTVKEKLTKIKKKKNLNDVKILSKYLDSTIKLIFASSIGVYCFKNSTKINKSNYLQSKFECENFMINNSKNYLVIRIPNIYGPNQKEHFLVPTILKKLKKDNKEIKINFYEDKRDYIHINDVVKIIIQSLKIKKNLRINIFSGNVYSVYNVLKLIVNKLKIKSLNIIKLKKNSIFKDAYYFKKIFDKDIGIRKFIDFEKGINF